MDSEQRALDMLSRLAAQPAVAFWESGVASVVTSILRELGLAPQTDAYGNIIAKVSGREPGIVPLALVAHMDHPGFEAIAAPTVGQDGCLVGKAMGGVPLASFESGVPLQLILSDGVRLPAVTAGRHGNEEERQVLIHLAEPARIELPCPVVFDLPDFQVDGNLIRMRAADDLAGCACILAALASFRGRTSRLPPGDVYGVFTRAEEVGLVGARLLAEAGTLPSSTLVVSLESSKTLPGAEQGGGPVIRVGDAGLTFSAEAEGVLSRARETLQADSGDFRAQRQLMSGGVCEASAFALYGYRTTGIAFPLGNYHNGTPDGAIGAEYIHRGDFLGGIQLITEAAHRVPDRENTVFRQRLRQVPDDLRERLTSTTPFAKD